MRQTQYHLRSDKAKERHQGRKLIPPVMIMVP